jgi:glycosidase
VTSASDAIRKGRFYELQDANNLGKEYNQRHLYAYLRYTDKQQLLVVVNFSADKTYQPTITIPAEAMVAMGLNTKKFYTYTDLLAPEAPLKTLKLTLAPLSAHIFELKPQ